MDRRRRRRPGGGGARRRARGSGRPGRGRMSRWTFAPAPRLRGTVTAPADKSLSHRAALLAAMTSDPVRVTNFLPAEDTLSTLRAVQALGVLVQENPDELVLRGPGLRAAAEADHVIDVGNAGTL